MEVGITRFAADQIPRWWVLDDAAAGFAVLTSGGTTGGPNGYATSIAFGNVDNDPAMEVGITRFATPCTMPCGDHKSALCGGGRSVWRPSLLTPQAHHGLREKGTWRFSPSLLKRTFVMSLGPFGSAPTAMLH